MQRISTASRWRSWEASKSGPRAEPGKNRRTWHALVRTVLVGEMPVPVLSLEYEFQSYQKLGQQDKAGIIRERLKRVT